MLTPQEVASRVFPKATLGGYNMSLVDEFLDTLTEDYTALYNDNTILKNKLKVLSDSLEEYRATDIAMRKTLLAAQQMAESMISEAERKKNELVMDAEAAAMTRMDELRRQIALEEGRLQSAREATATYIQQVRALHTGALAYLERLEELTGEADPAPAPDPAQEQKPPMQADALGNSIISTISASAPPEDEQPTRTFPTGLPADKPPVSGGEPEGIQRFDSLQHGKDYTIT